MRKISVFIIIAVFFFTEASVVAEHKEGKWKKLKYSDGILVEKRHVEGSPLMAFRGRGTINGSILEILSIISDAKNHSQWVANCIEAKILEQLAPRKYVYYSSTKTPWPLNDRDFVSLAKIHVNKKNHSIAIVTHETKHEKAPKNTGRVRMSFIRVTWYMKALKKYKGKKTYIVFKVHANPGGSIPNWIVNMVSKKIPYKSIKNLEKRVASGKIDKSFLEKYKQYKDWY